MEFKPILHPLVAISPLVSTLVADAAYRGYSRVEEG